MRVGVVDLGTNSTRMLVADVADRAVREVDRRTEVTRLGDSLEATARLSQDAMARVHEVVAQYVKTFAAHGCEAVCAVMTSAVRDAVNGAAFSEEVEKLHGLEGRVLTGEEEAGLTFLGAAAGRAAVDDGAICVIDVGGGSTELVTGRDGEVESHASLQLGVVRHTERHLHSDPPADEELQALADDVRAALAQALPEPARRTVTAGVAVAGTPTSCAAIAQELDPYDRERVEGYALELAECEELLARLGDMPLAQRCRLTGLHPDRAPTIVAGVMILIEALRFLDLDRTTVSERDILHGAALDRAGFGKTR
jgi:exopolyphosphatase/guanosine-5'-triphosphate,3'-diphosphate pyrophosphatase